MTEGPVQYIVDRELVVQEITRSRATLERGRGRWFIRTFARSAIVFYAIAIAAQWSRSGPLDALPPAKRVTFFVFPALMALFIAWWSGRNQFSQRALDPDQQVRDIADNLRSLGGPGWVMRSLRTGVALGAAIGIPVGTLLAFTWRPDVFPATSRWMVLPGFTGMTLMWTIPFAFVLRWLSLLGLKRFVKAVPAPRG